MGMLYKRVIDVLRSSPTITRWIFGVKVHQRRIPYMWDVTTLVLKKAIDKHIPPGGAAVLDMGCGHVCMLAQYVKRTKPANTVRGAEIYEEFYHNALENVRRNNLDVRIDRSDLYESVSGKFDYVFSNLPYVPVGGQPITVATQHFPKAAFSGKDGTDTTVKFLEDSRTHLRNGGKLLLGMNCFYVSHERMMEIIREARYELLDVVERRMNTAKVFVLTPSRDDKQRANGSPQTA
jgi:methylase of polypeptide subunit release factors